MKSETLHGLYIARIDLAQPHLAGVSRKIKAQISAFQKALGPVTLITPQHDQVAQDGVPITDFKAGKLSTKLLHLSRFYKTVASNDNTFDYIYIRYQRSSLAFISMLHALRKKNPKSRIIVEIPTWPYRAEAVSLREKVLQFTDQLFCRFMARYVDRIVTFSSESEIFGIPTICTENGTDVFHVEKIDPPKSDTTLHLLGLANLAFWHGYDRVIDGISKYMENGGSHEVIFNIVGAGAELENLKKTAAQKGVADHIHFHGPLFGENLTSVMKSCHIGVSTIAIHRSPKDTSSLKSREFCARGMPFILSTPERDLEHNFPYIFYVPENDDPVDIAALVTFFQHLNTTHPNYAVQMRRFAEEHLTWDTKMRPVFEYLRPL